MRINIYMTLWRNLSGPVFSSANYVYPFSPIWKPQNEQK